MQNSREKTAEELNEKHRNDLMTESVKKFTDEQRGNILHAVLTFKEGDTGMMLEDITSLYFMAMEHYLMDDKATRENKTTTFLFLHNFIAHLDCILNERDGFYSLAV